MLLFLITESESSLCVFLKTASSVSDMFVLVFFGSGKVKAAAALFKYFLYWLPDLQVPVAPLIFCHSTGAAVHGGRRQIGTVALIPGATLLTRPKRGGISKSCVFRHLVNISASTFKLDKTEKGAELTV